MIRKNYLKAVVIVHGKSEKQMCQYVKQKLRLPIHIESSDNGKTSIQITSVMNNVLKNSNYKDMSSFKRYFGDKLEKNLASNKKLADYFKIFIIVDTDDCTPRQKEDYINKNMFNGHWAYDYIVPLYNSPKLETILKNAEIPFTHENDSERKKEYIKIFPTDPKYIQQSKDVIQIDFFMKKLKKTKNTNMEEFIEFCLNLLN